MSNEEKNNGFNRVVITGMGAISPAGFGVDALWSKVASGECCFTLLPEEKREQLNVSVVGAIPDYDPLKAGFSKKESRRFAPLWIKRTLLVLRACSDLVLAAWKFSSVNPSCCTKKEQSA